LKQKCEDRNNGDPGTRPGRLCPQPVAPSLSVVCFPAERDDAHWARGRRKGSQDGSANRCAGQDRKNEEDERKGVCERVLRENRRNGSKTQQGTLSLRWSGRQRHCSAAQAVCPAFSLILSLRCLSAPLLERSIKKRRDAPGRKEIRNWVPQERRRPCIYQPNSQRRQGAGPAASDRCTGTHPL